MSRVVKSAGMDLSGPFTRMDVGSGDQILETTLRGTSLEVDWVQGRSMIFNLVEVQTAAGGPGSIATITGYVTDQLAMNVQQPGYVERLATVIGGRLGGQWTGNVDTMGGMTYLLLERAP